MIITAIDNTHPWAKFQVSFDERMTEKKQIEFTQLFLGQHIYEWFDGFTLLIDPFMAGKR